ncbi:MAG: hypothetical protein A2Y95_11240 [Deltaproteobacteria bacterium RBG_13_65_10]|nr:MAG: hypothetical protein A2Y95_11240 [Deltaproteobacteria bacterium RBG_13_65_10]
MVDTLKLENSGRIRAAGGLDDASRFTKQKIFAILVEAETRASGGWHHVSPATYNRWKPACGWSRAV